MDIYDLQYVAGTCAKQGSLLDDEELLLLGGPKQPPRAGEVVTGGHSAGAQGCHRVNGFDDGGPPRGVALRPEAAVLVRDEGEKVLPGGLGLGGDGGADEPWVRVAWVGELGDRVSGFKRAGKKDGRGGHGHG